MPPWGDALATLRGVERWLLPAECLLCRRPVSSPGEPLACNLCRSRWSPMPDPACPRCGQPEEAGLACRICRDWPPGFGTVRSAVWLTGGARAAVHHLKYGGWWRMGEAMAPAMSPLVAGGRNLVLIPLPLGTARQRERGYNQSEILARSLAAGAGLVVRTDLLRRTRETRRQTGLTPDARQANVHGAFAARRPAAGIPVLVDDVFTTGATLLSAAHALLAAGATEVRAVTFARARRPLDDDVARLAESGETR